MDYRIFAAKARENVAAAGDEFDAGRYNACANRAYYAMFHAALAALLAHDVKPSTRPGHDWVQANFNERLIKRRKVYPSRLAPQLLAAMDIRHTADYRDQMVSRKMAGRMLRMTQQFVETVLAGLEEEK